MEELTIDREFANLCPELTPEEFKLLEQSIVDEGCREPITLWANHDDTILDGHNRYKICRKHDVKFKTRSLNLDHDEAVAWVLRNQLGRRNLSESQRSMLAGKMPTSGKGGDQSANLHIAPTVSEIAEQFNVSERSVASARKVVANGAAVLQKAVESGEVKVSAAAVIAELPKAEQAKVVAKGPEAVAKKVKQIKEKKPKKEPEFDTAKLDKELAKEKKNGRVSGFEEKKLDDAFRKLSQSLDEQYNKLQTLYMEREASMGGSAQLFDKCKRAAKVALSKSHDNVNDALGALKTWRNGR